MAGITPALVLFLGGVLCVRLLIKNTSDNWKYIGKYNVAAGAKKEVILTESQYEQLKRKRSLEILEDYSQEENEDNEEVEETTDPEIEKTEEEVNKKENNDENNENDEKEKVENNRYPDHLGGGWYELSDGSKIRGQEEALEAEYELEAEGSEE